MGLSRNVLKMNKFGQVEPFTFILSTKSYKHLGQLNNVKTDTIDFKANLNGANEISFEVYKKVNGEVEALWDSIIDLKSIYVPELDEYFEIQVVYNDKLDELKIITGTSLCEAELSQTIIHGTEINTQTDSDRADFKRTTFYNELDPKASLLNRVLSFAPHYSIGHVDSTLHNIQRTFSIDGTSIYDFLIGECSEQFNCIFVFDSTDRTINAYDLYTTCYDCGHRDAYNFVCPKCGSENVNYFGQDTSIFVDKENLSDDIKLETDVGSIKNCFRLRAGDDDMTTDVVSINPNGTAYIYYITPEQRVDMSEELVNKIDSYDELVEQYTPEYQELTQDIRDLEDEITYYSSTMMPKPVDDDEEVPEDSISKTEIIDLTVENLSPVGMESMTSSTSKDTIDIVVKNYARVFVNTSLVKIDVVEGSTFEYKGKDADSWDYGIWKGKLQLTAYSDANDIAITDTLTLTIHDNYGDFLKQKVMKEMALNDKEGSVFDVLSIEEIEDFKEALAKYCLSRLNSFRLSLDTAITTLVSLDQAAEEADWYSSIYVPYHEKLLACADEIIVREEKIKELEDQLLVLVKRQSEIQAILNFEDYLGTDLYLEFCTYRREDEYHNENYISEGLSTAERIDKAKEFLEVAKKELIRSAIGQHTISANLYNIMLMEEFKPLLDKFALGNFIRVKAGSELYRLRLNSYNITFSDLSTINTEFSDMTKSVNVVTATQKILSDAQSMASNFSYISKQAEKGKDASESLNDIVQSGLDSSLAQIKNNVNEEAIIDNNGYLGRSLDDVTGKYLPEQVRLTHNILAFTEDNWAHSSCALGKHKYTYYNEDNDKFEQAIGYGLSSKFVQSAYIYGSKIISGDIYSENYSSTDNKGTHLNLNDGSFNFGHKIIYDAPTDKLTMKGVDIEWSSSTTPEISDIDGLSEDLAQKSASITANANAITSEVTRAKNAESNLSSSITQTANSITSKVNAVEKNLSDNYSTTTQMNSAITQSANSIKSEVSEEVSNTYETKSNASAQYNTLSSTITQTANEINLEVSKKIGADEVISTINVSDEQITLGTGRLVIDSTNFKLSADGTMEATNGTFSGSITATSGKITGNLEIGGSLTHTSGNYAVTLRGVQSSAGYGVFYITDKSSGTNTYPFIVNGDGSFTATKANITGTITATNGTIGGCSISNGKLTVPSANISGTITATALNAATGSINSVTATNLTVTSGKITLGAVTLDSSAGSSLGKFKVDSNSLYYGTWSSPNTPAIFLAASSSNSNYTIAGVSSKNWAIGAGTNFGVTLDGKMYCKSGKIGNLTINSDGTVGSDNILIHPNGYKPTGSTITYYLVIYNSQKKPVGGLSTSGWSSISA